MMFCTLLLSVTELTVCTVWCFTISVPIIPVKHYVSDRHYYTAGIVLVTFMSIIHITLLLQAGSGMMCGTHVLISGGFAARNSQHLWIFFSNAEGTYVYSPY